MWFGNWKRDQNKKNILYIMTILSVDLKLLIHYSHSLPFVTQKKYRAFLLWQEAQKCVNREEPVYCIFLNGTSVSHVRVLLTAATTTVTECKKHKLSWAACTDTNRDEGKKKY